METIYLVPVLIFLIGVVSTYALSKFLLNKRVEYNGNKNEIELEGWDTLGGYITSAVLAVVLSAFSFMYSDCQANKQIMKDEHIIKLKQENSILTDRLRMTKDSIRKEIVKELSNDE